MSFLAKAAAIFMMTAVAGCTVGPDYLLPKEREVQCVRGAGPVRRRSKQPGRARRSVAGGMVAALPEPRPRSARHRGSRRKHRLARGGRQSRAQPRDGRSREDRSSSRTWASAARSIAHAIFGRNNISTPLHLPPYNIYDISLSASYDADLFGRIRRGIEAAEADDDAVEAARDWVRVTVAADVTRAYLEVCTAGDELAVARHSVDLQQQSLALTRQLEAGGAKDPSRRDTLPGAGGPAAIEHSRDRGAPTQRPLSIGDINRQAAGRVPSQPRQMRCPRRPSMRPSRSATARRCCGGARTCGRPSANWRLPSPKSAWPRPISTRSVVLNASVVSTGITSDFLTYTTNDWCVGPGVSWELNQSAPARKDRRSHSNAEDAARPFRWRRARRVAGRRNGAQRLQPRFAAARRACRRRARKPPKRSRTPASWRLTAAATPWPLSTPSARSPALRRRSRPFGRRSPRIRWPSSGRWAGDGKRRPQVRPSVPDAPGE